LVNKVPASKIPQSGVRERLFTTALEAFALHGYAEVSVDEIVKKARTTKPMLYYYFGSKAKLYEAIATESVGILRAGYRAAEEPGLTPLERLRAFVRSDFKTVRTHPHLARFIYRAAYSQPREAPAIDYWQLFMPLFQLVNEILAAAQTEGLVGPGAPPLLALPLFGMLSMWTQVSMAGQGPIENLLSEDQADKVVEFYLNGVGARK
jgi:AcrR family transcriptional regulator